MVIPSLLSMNYDRRGRPKIVSKTPFRGTYLMSIWTEEMRSQTRKIPIGDCRKSMVHQFLWENGIQRQAVSLEGKMVIREASNFAEIAPAIFQRPVAFAEMGFSFRAHL